jgi:predicted DNA-binding transcriptional regulator YafY
MRAFLSAVRSGRSIEIHYRSMNPKHTGAVWRRITPHAFAHDGFRWHARAYCHIHKEFRDFILGRCLQVRGVGDAEARSDDDKHWHTFFDVILAPNPALSLGQQQTVSLDYNMPDGKKIISVRQALLYYFRSQHRLDLIDNCEDPNMCPLIIVNMKEFEEAINAKP